jgi:hypothetical protein
MARVFVVAREALAERFRSGYVGDEGLLTIVIHWVRYLMRYRSRRFDSKARPLLHGSAVYGFAIMLCIGVSQCLAEQLQLHRLTLKLIQEIGSSLGISVFLISSSVRASSSKAKVKMAPGGVQVPTMR